MHRSSAARLSAFIVSLGACFFLLGGSALGAQSPKAGKSGALTPKVKHSLKNDRSPALRSARPVTSAPSGPPRQAAKNAGPAFRGPGVRGVDPVVQHAFGGSPPMTPILNFDGSTAADNTPFYGFTVAPSDVNGAVGNGYYFQTVNSVFQIFETSTGDSVLGPIPGTALFTGFGGLCETGIVIDPVVQYDELANRWMVGFISIDIDLQDDFHICMAVSTSNDPTGSYNRYDYDFDLNIPDYPKWGVWPDAYYMTVNQFEPFFTGIGSWAFDRDAMLAGSPATAIGFDLGGDFPDMFSMLPADLDGSNPPPPGSPNYQVTLGHPVWDGSPDPVLHWFEFTPDFVTPGNSTLTGPVDLPIPDLNPDLCGFSRACIPNLDGTPFDPIPGRVMAGMQYRNLGAYETMLVTQTVNVSETGDLAAIRWYEIRTPDTPSLHQSGTYSPSDTNRFMPSGAIDINGNIAIGYSVSDATIYPAIGVAARLATDPLGQLGVEDVFFSGTGGQIGTADRWGDYTGMAVDPADGCTFWYTNQYYETTGSFDWRTRIASFKFPSCTIGPTGTLEGTVTDGTNPIADATVTAGLASTTTDAAGFYSFELPVDTYDMTASKYGYIPGSADDVVVTQDTTTVQDFTLALAPTVDINGTVKDGSGGGWPLYAKIVVSGPGYPGATLWTDPVTGYYEITLVEGITYSFVITAVSPGYQTGGGPVDLSITARNAPFVVHNWTLEVDATACNAPGYSQSTSGLFEDFSGGAIPPGWTNENNSLDGGFPWAVAEGADPCGEFAGNLTGGDGPYAIVNSNCDGFVTEDTNLITPSVDMSAFTSPVLRFNSDYLDCCGSTITADVSDDGGANWTNVYQKNGASDRGPKSLSFDLGDFAGEADVTARFHFDGFWAWWWQVDNVLLGEAACNAGTGGLVVGNVFDVNAGTGLLGATVTKPPSGPSTTTFATPDPNQEDGFYILYLEAGGHSLEASKTNYATDVRSVVVVPGGVVEKDFFLSAGRLEFAPRPLNSRLDPGDSEDQTLTVSNTGSSPAEYELIEINAPPPQTETVGFADQAKRQQAINRLPKDEKGRHESKVPSTRDLPRMPNALVPGLPTDAGDVTASFPSDITFGWGVATVGTDFWLSNIAVAGGDDQDYQYSGGAKTGETIDLAGIGDWAADGAFNSITGKFWRVSVGGDNCIYELDPVTKQQTGETICGSPWAGISQRGLAYDAAGDTFFIGGWNEGVIYHIDTDGNVLDSAFVGISISGLAYNAGNGHLLVMRNDVVGNDITVLDALDNYNVLAEYPILDGGSPAITEFGGAGAEFDCVGNLVVIDQNTQTVYYVETGEGAGCEVDIPWLSLDPTSGIVAQGATQDITATFDATGLLPGLRQAQVSVKTFTPYNVPSIPVNLTVRFLDVPDDNQFEAFIYAAAGAGIMFGGPPPCPAGILNFCPNGVVTRADMAGYLWRAVNGKDTPPPVYQNIFGDVTFNDYNSFYIQGIFDLGITAGCGNGNYCPDDANTRGQMSVFILLAVEGGDYVPPPCSGVFNDVPCPSQFADYIEELADRGVTAGCGGGNFCPDANITNGQMSVFLVKAFNVPHL